MCDIGCAILILLMLMMVVVVVAVYGGVGLDAKANKR